VKANEDWRRDPARRNDAIALCGVYVNRYLKLLAALEQAQLTVNEILFTHGKDKPGMGFAVEIHRCKRKIEHYSNPTEILIGNMAAFGEKI
jgi:hypothetical protein